MTGTQSTGTPSEDKRKNTGHFFKHPGTPPFKLYLYYLEDPERVFSYDEYHYENHKGCLYAVISFLPWILQSFSYLSCRSSFHFSAYVVCRERRRRIESKSRDVIKTFLF